MNPALPHTRTPTHIYLVVTCRTPGCGTQAAVRYHGILKDQLDMSGVPNKTFTHECARCHQRHEYTTADTEIESFDFPPPPGWKDEF